MVDEEKNLSFFLEEGKTIKKDEEITYEELLKNVDAMDIPSDNSYESQYEYMDYGYEDECFAVELNYQTNYTKKQLERIADYYEISKRKKSKQQLVDSIVIFESSDNNFGKVLQRKKLWMYIKEIKADKYLSKFLILD